MSHATTPGDTSGYTQDPTSNQQQMSSGPTPAPQPTGWVGWIGFAAVMMILVGTFHVIQGLVALFEDDYFLVASSGLIVSVDYTAWGWAHMIGGAILIGSGMALFTGKVWARVVAVVLAMLSAVDNLGFRAAYPTWSAIMIAVDILVIWAVIVHGDELRQ
jgi:hypothetical protein